MQMNIFGGTERPRVHHAPHAYRNPKPRGYAAQPGTGPEGETCGTCGNCRVKCLGKNYHKCGLMLDEWTSGRESDVAVRSPACKHWTAGAPRATGIHTIGGHHD